MVFTLTCLFAFGAREAHAWVELTVANDDILVAADKKGLATVEHRVTLLVSGGPLVSVDLVGVDADASVTSDGFVILEKDAKKNLSAAMPIGVTKIDAGPETLPALRISLNNGAGLHRGAYTLVVRYTTDLFAGKRLRREGGSYLLSWVGPLWTYGLDATRATFRAPIAPTAPALVEDETGNATFLASSRREEKFDVLEVTRPYAARGERVVWNLRFDARAFEGEALAPEPASSAPIPTSNETEPPRNATWFFVAGLVVFVALAGANLAKGREVVRMCEERGATPTPLVPLPLTARALVSAMATVGGLLLMLGFGRYLEGALAWIAAALLSTYRPATVPKKLRGPGKWLAVSTTEAFRDPVFPKRVFDIGTLVGAATSVGVVAVVAGSAYAFFGLSNLFALAMFSTLPVLVLFFTGRLRDTPPDLAASSVPFLRAVAREVTRQVERHGMGAVRVVPRVRIPDGSADADEMRLTFHPQRARRGLRSIEVGFSYAGGLGGYLMLPEILLRVDEGSACEQAVGGLASRGKVTKGRRVDEKVIAIAPKLPTVALTARLVVALVGSVVDPALPTRTPTPPGERRDASLPLSDAASAA